MSTLSNVKNETSVFVNPIKLKQWVICYENSSTYYPSEKNPLLDILKDTNGNQVRIYLTNKQ